MNSGLQLYFKLSYFTDLSNEDAANIALGVIYGITIGKCYAEDFIHKLFNKNIPALSIYFWIVVYSFFCELKEGGPGNSQVMAMEAKA